MDWNKGISGLLLILGWGWYVVQYDCPGNQCVRDVQNVCTGGIWMELVGNAHAAVLEKIEGS